MRIIPVFILSVFLFSCSNENNEKHEPAKADTTASITSATDSVITDTLTAIEQAVVVAKPDAKLSDEDRLRLFRDAYLINYNELKNTVDAYHVLDRFTSEKKFALYLQKKFPIKYGKVENVIPIAQLRLYVYADSAQKANAVNNWLNCFGKDCNTIEKGEATTIKSTPGYYIINDKSILCLDYMLEFQENNWDEWFKNLNSLFKRSNSTIIQVKPHGKVVWVKS